MDGPLRKLIEACEREGKPPLNRLKMVKEGKYSPDEVKFLEPYLKDSHENIRILVLDILCQNGNPIIDYVDELGTLSSRMIAEIIKLAELQHDPFLILRLVNGDGRKNMHSAVLALNRMGEKDLLTGLMFSDDQELAHLIGELQ